MRVRRLLRWGDRWPWAPPVIRDESWQMAWGERMALEGLLSQLEPRLAIEIGTADGGSLRRMAAHAGEVHCFDHDPKVSAVAAAVPNAEAHLGPSTETLPPALAAFAAAGRNVDFALVDGDHSAAGVQADMRALLDSPACERTVVAIHDTANEEVRDGLEALGLPDHRKVAVCFLDFVPGYIVVPEHERADEIWNGLGLVVLDPARARRTAMVDADHVNVSDVLRAYRASERARRTG